MAPYPMPGNPVPTTREGTTLDAALPDPKLSPEDQAIIRNHLERLRAAQAWARESVEGTPVASRPSQR